MNDKRTKLTVEEKIVIDEALDFSNPNLRQEIFYLLFIQEEDEVFKNVEINYLLNLMFLNISESKERTLNLEKIYEAKKVFESLFINWKIYAPSQIFEIFTVHIKYRKVSIIEISEILKLAKKDFYIYNKIYNLTKTLIFKKNFDYSTLFSSYKDYRNLLDITLCEELIMVLESSNYDSTTIILKLYISSKNVQYMKNTYKKALNMLFTAIKDINKNFFYLESILKATSNTCDKALKTFVLDEVLTLASQESNLEVFNYYELLFDLFMKYGYNQNESYKFLSKRFNFSSRTKLKIYTNMFKYDKEKSLATKSLKAICAFFIANINKDILSLEEQYEFLLALSKYKKKRAVKVAKELFELTNDLSIANYLINEGYGANYLEDEYICFYSKVVLLTIIMSSNSSNVDMNLVHNLILSENFELNIFISIICEKLNKNLVLEILYNLYEVKNKTSDRLTLFKLIPIEYDFDFMCEMLLKEKLTIKEKLTVISFIKNECLRKESLNNLLNVSS